VKSFLFYVEQLHQYGIKNFVRFFSGPLCKCTSVLAAAVGSGKSESEERPSDQKLTRQLPTFIVKSNFSFFSL